MLLTKRLNVRDDERVVTVVRRSVAAVGAPAALAVGAITLAFFLITPLFARGRIGVAVFTALLAIGVIAGCRCLWLRYWNALVVTDRRLIDVAQRGFFHRQVSEARFENVEDIAVEIRGVVATLFHLGTLRILVAGGHVVIELRYVPRPEVVQELLGRLRERARVAGTPSAVTALPSDLSGFSESALTDLRGRIDVELARREERQVAQQRV